MKKSELYLSKRDAINYKALVNFLRGAIVCRGGTKRPLSEIPTRALRLYLAQKQGYRCEDCGKEFIVKGGKVLGSTVDHVIMYKYGGTLCRNNSSLLCEPCNNRRGAEYSIDIIESHFGKIDFSMIPELQKVDV